MNIAIVGLRDYPNDSDPRRFIKSLPVGTVVSSPMNATERDDYLAESRQLIAAADVVMAFWDGESLDTAYMVVVAHVSGKPLYVVRPGDPLPVIAELTP